MRHSAICICIVFVFFQCYEARIDALQKQVEEQSMTMSMYSSYTPEDFNNDDDIFGKCCLLVLSKSFVRGKYVKISAKQMLRCA